MSTIPEPDGQDSRNRGRCRYRQHHLRAPGPAGALANRPGQPLRRLGRRAPARGWLRARRLLLPASRGSPNLPSTSQPSVGDFLAVYEPLARGRPRRRLDPHRRRPLRHLRERPRGGANARRARPAGPDRGVSDGETGAGGLGCLVLAAAEAAERGLALEQVAATVAETHTALEIWFCLDTLEYLRKGGRIGAAQALLGSALKIKPILTFGTEIAPVGRVRTAKPTTSGWSPTCGSCTSAAPRAGSSSTPSCPEEAAALVAAGEEILGSEPLFCSEVGPVLGAHLGSGMLVGGVGCAPASA